eukprot:SAG31_NODE_535_length_14348_cov_11.339603_21_plen_147_part_00
MVLAPHLIVAAPHETLLISYGYLLIARSTLNVQAANEVLACGMADVGYLRQLLAASAEAETSVAVALPPGAPPEPLQASQRRLAFAMQLCQRLGSVEWASDSDVIAQVGPRILGFDHAEELRKTLRFGEGCHFLVLGNYSKRNTGL